LFSCVYFLSLLFSEFLAAKFGKIFRDRKNPDSGGGMRSPMIGMGNGSAYRGKAAIFRIMESTMAYRGFRVLRFCALAENAPAPLVGRIVDFPRYVSWMFC
jgi:hypothetical protein